MKKRIWRSKIVTSIIVIGLMLFWSIQVQVSAEGSIPEDVSNNTESIEEPEEIQDIIANGEETENIETNEDETIALNKDIVNDQLVSTEIIPYGILDTFHIVYVPESGFVTISANEYANSVIVNGKISVNSYHSYRVVDVIINGNGIVSDSQEVVQIYLDGQLGGINPDDLSKDIISLEFSKNNDLPLYLASLDGSFKTEIKVEQMTGALEITTDKGLLSYETADGEMYFSGWQLDGNGSPIVDINGNKIPTFSSNVNEALYISGQNFIVDFLHSFQVFQVTDINSGKSISVNPVAGSTKKIDFDTSTDDPDNNDKDKDKNDGDKNNGDDTKDDNKDNKQDNDNVTKISNNNNNSKSNGVSNSSTAPKTGDNTATVLTFYIVLLLSVSVMLIIIKIKNKRIKIS